MDPVEEKFKFVSALNNENLQEQYFISTNIFVLDNIIILLTIYYNEIKQNIQQFKNILEIKIQHNLNT